MGIGVFLRFRYLFMWLKFTTITPSFYFRNRLFIEKGFRTNNMYTFTGNTQKSFTWLRNSSSNLSLYWFKRRGLKWFLFVLLLVALAFIYLDFFHFSSLYSTQLFRSLFYIVWRSFDGFFFLTTQFLVFALALFSWVWNFFLNTYLVRYLTTTQKPTIVRTKAPTYVLTTQLLPKTEERLLTSSPLTHLFETSTGCNSTNYWDFTDTTRRLYSFSFFLQPETSTKLPCPAKLSLYTSSSSKITKPFTLGRLIPTNTKSIKNTLLGTNNYKNYPSLFTGTPTPLTFDLLYITKKTSTRTLRWLSNYSPVSVKDINYIRNLPVLLNTSPLPTHKQPLTSQQTNLNNLLTPYQALEWLSYRSNFFSQLIAAQTLPQHKMRFNSLLDSRKETPLITTNTINLTDPRTFNYWNVINLALNPLNINSILMELYLNNSLTQSTKKTKEANKKIHQIRRWF
uniref:Cytochrome c-type biogenesis protein CcmF_ii n=1 Tax=Euplotes vannus TaxID=5939 RepID=UPI002E79D3D8|nr:Cytochrome c-type biogenesis protein CcmF_ii [Euplotes vannus]UPM52088.1 Cytochrome c-type biogenesis protein CcmF_ii [Euplotes vannus]